jgi:hypothetical protein
MRESLDPARIDAIPIVWHTPQIRMHGGCPDHRTFGDDVAEVDGA